MTTTDDRCAFADEGCTCGRPPLTLTEGTEVEQLRADIDDRDSEISTLRQDLDLQTKAAWDNNAKVAELTAELDRVRADLAAAHNHAHRQDTNLQQIARAKDEIAAERDQLKRALRAAINGQTHVWDKQRIDWVPVAEYTACKQAVAR